MAINPNVIQDRNGPGNAVADALTEVLTNQYVELHLGLQNNQLSKIFMDENHVRKVVSYSSEGKGTRKVSIRVLSYFPDGDLTFSDDDIANPTWLSLDAIKRTFTTQRATLGYVFTMVFVKEEPQSLSEFVQDTVKKMFDYVYAAENKYVELALRSSANNIIFGGSATSLATLDATTSKLSKEKFKEATNKLIVAEIGSVLEGGLFSQGTVDPVLRRYVAIVPASKITEIEALTGFRKLGSYEVTFSNTQAYLPNEFGSLDDVAFVLDTRNLGNVPASAVVGNVHIAYSNIYIIGNVRPVTTFYNVFNGVNVLGRYKAVSSEAGSLIAGDIVKDVAGLAIDFWSKNYLTQDATITKSYIRLVVA